MPWSAYCRFAAALLGGRISGTPRPLSVNFHITGNCNANCRYCYGDFGRHPAGELPLADVRRLLDEIRASGGILIQLSGGEPLMRDDLPAILYHCTLRGLIPVVSTNGILLPDRLPELTAATGFFISIDGDQAATDLLRGPGSYAAAVRALAACTRVNAAAVINSVLSIHTATVTTIDHLVSLAREFNAGVKFHFLLAGRQGPPPAELLPRPEQYSAALAHIQHLLAAGAPITYSPATYRLAGAWLASHPCYLLGQEPQVPYARCFAGRYMCMIDADGCVYPCAQALAFFPARNALTDGFHAAWKHAAHGNPCRGCGAPQYIEPNLLFASDPGIIFRQGRMVVQHWWRQQQRHRSAGSA